MRWTRRRPWSGNSGPGNWLPKSRSAAWCRRRARAVGGRGPQSRYITKEGIQRGRDTASVRYRYGILDGGQGARLGTGVALRASLLPHVALGQQIAAIDHGPRGNTAAKAHGGVERIGLERHRLFGVSRRGSVVDVVLRGVQGVLERLQGAGRSEYCGTQGTHGIYPKNEMRPRMRTGTALPEAVYSGAIERRAASQRRPRRAACSSRTPAWRISFLG